MTRQEHEREKSISGRGHCLCRGSQVGRGFRELEFPECDRNTEQGGGVRDEPRGRSQASVSRARVPEFYLDSSGVISNFKHGTHLEDSRKASWKR